MNLAHNKQFYIYSHSSVPWQQQILFDFLKSISIRKNFRCLDAGCGIGNNLKTLSVFIDDITACDISKDALDYSKKKFQEGLIKFVEASVEKLPFPDNYFDLVVCTEVLEHVENLERAEKELMRVVKKENGYLIISAPNYFNLAGIVKFIIDKITGKQEWDVWGTGKERKERFMTFFKLKKIMSTNKAVSIIKERGGDFLNSWFLFLPLIFRNYKYTDKRPALWLGRSKFFRKFAMNYFILAKTNSHQ